MKGSVIVKTFDYDGGRLVTLYLPPEPPRAIVLAGDGDSIQKWIQTLEEANLPPIAMVGVQAAATEDLRLREYSPVFDKDRFAAHETFFVEEVWNWACSEIGSVLAPERTALFGASAGAELALALGLKHPDMFNIILCLSPGAGYKPPDNWPTRLPRVYLAAGDQEPFFLKNATRWAKALKSAGGEVVMKERSGTHGGSFWVDEFALMLGWAFGENQG